MATTTSKRPSARERLLAASDELFYRDGVHSTGIDAIIERAGVAKGSLYYIFGGKDELVADPGATESKALADALIVLYNGALTTAATAEPARTAAMTAKRIARLTLAAAKASSSA